MAKETKFTENVAMEKGNSLQRAVETIEKTILRFTTGLEESDLSIEGKKVLSINGVRHEIDILVRAKLPAGYESSFIFECKNTKSKVDKNDIIIFSEKIRACRAQKGFFVAKNYTRDAINQANNDGRIELITFEELNPDEIKLPRGLHGIYVGDSNFNITFIVSGAIDCKNISISASDFKHNGEIFNMQEYIDTYIEDLKSERTNQFPAQYNNGDKFTVDIDEFCHIMKDKIKLFDHQLLGIVISGKIEVSVHRSQIVSVFDVKSRGRFISTKIDMPVGEFGCDFVSID